jgi:hypothetical protein
MASTGLIHDYLGITINFDERHKVKFTMIDYLEDILSEMPSDMRGIARTPAQDDLFTVDEGSPLLNVVNVNSFQAIAPLTGQKKGSFFKRGIFPSKIDPKDFY